MRTEGCLQQAAQKLKYPISVGKSYEGQRLTEAHILLLLGIWNAAEGHYDDRDDILGTAHDIRMVLPLLDSLQRYHRTRLA